MRGPGLVTLLVALAGPAVAQTPAAPPVLLERTLAIVGGVVVLQSDVTLALALGLVDGADPSSPEAVLPVLLDRRLMLQEVARFAPAEPAADVVAARVAAVRARAGDDAAVTRALTASGREPSYLTTWVRDDLRIAAYLQQRFASTGAPVDTDIATYLQAHGSEFAAAGLDTDTATSVARTRLIDERRRELIADWLADLRRRTPIVIFAPRP